MKGSTVRLEELRQLIIDSDRERDWHDIIIGTYYTEVPNVDDDTYEWPHSMIVYRDDVDLTIQWGLPARRLRHVTTARQLWDEHGAFPDPSARTELADIFWRGNLVDRVELAVVDGGRATLPVGSSQVIGYDHSRSAEEQEIRRVYWATQFQVAVARLLDTVGEFERYFGQTTMSIRG